jgi:hypothetical protein
LATRDLPASLRCHEREHFRVIEKPTPCRARPMRTSNDLITEDNNRPDRKFVCLKASARFG